MPLSLILAMITYALAMSLSPGPVNIVCVATGASHGFRRTVPFVSGASLGFMTMLFTTGLGLYQIIAHYPVVLHALSVAGFLFISYLAYRIATARPKEADAPGQPPTLAQGALLMGLNPKAWFAAVSGVALFTDPASRTPFLVFASLYFVVGYGCLLAWTLLGDRAALLLQHPRRLRVFNVTMGLLLFATACYLIVSQFGLLS
jgi:threonine/homoserine/homoserine lactone efflux protein